MPRVGEEAATDVRESTLGAPHPATVRETRAGPLGFGGAHGPLPALLLGLTVVTGLVDAFSYLSLGHVFVANMTGNVIFLGFGLAGVGDIAVSGSLVAILGFAVGAVVAGRWSIRRAPHRGHLLAAVTAAQSVLVLAAAVIAQIAGVAGSAVQLILVALLGVAMGGQNAVARRLAVPDLTTTVLTLTFTGLVADSTPWPVRVRRGLSLTGMLVGALAGGTLLRFVSTAAPLWLAVAILVACATTAAAMTRSSGARAWR